MQRCAFFIALACIFAVNRIELFFNDQTHNESETTHGKTKSTNQNRGIKRKAEMTFEAPPPTDYLCNNETFDWMVQTLVTKIAQLTEEIKGKEAELQRVQRVRRFFCYYI